MMEMLTYLRRSVHDPMPGTQIASVAFQDRAAKAMSNQQSFRLYYQQVDGAMREMRYDSPSPGWQNATTIFTDAKNYTGMASFTYLNGTEQNVRGMSLGEYTEGPDMEAYAADFRRLCRFEQRPSRSAKDSFRPSLGAFVLFGERGSSCR